jgi:hypothetical protein
MKTLAFLVMAVMMNSVFAKQIDNIQFDRRMVITHLNNMRINIERLEEVLGMTKMNPVIEHALGDIEEFCELSEDLLIKSEGMVHKADLANAFIPFAEIANHISEVIENSQQLYSTYNITLHWGNVRWYVWRLSLHLDVDLDSLDDHHDDDDHDDDHDDDQVIDVIGGGHIH